MRNFLIDLLKDANRKWSASHLWFNLSNAVVLTMYVVICLEAISREATVIDFTGISFFTAIVMGIITSNKVAVKIIEGRTGIKINDNSGESSQSTNSSDGKTP
jgi:hypothetical protein